MFLLPFRARRLTLLALLCVFLAGCGAAPQQVSNPPAAIEAVPPMAATTVIATPATAAPAPAPATPAVKPATPGNIYLALGDSVTYGLGASLPGHTNFAGVFYNYLRQLPQVTRFENLAISGETTQSFIDGPQAQLAKALAQIDAAKNVGLSIGPVTLMIGANDMLNTRGQSAGVREATLVTYERNLNTILDRLHEHLAAYPTANLILLTYYNPYGGDPSNANSEAAWGERLNSVIRKAAATRTLRLVDTDPLFVGKTDALTWIAWGDVHPTDVGHALIANAVWQTSGYDTTAPSLRLIYPAGTKTANTVPLQAGGTNPVRLALKVAATDNLSQPPASVRVLVDGADVQGMDAVPTAPTQYTTILDTSSLTPGAHSVRIVATDTAGNVGSLSLPLTVQS